MRTTVTFQRYSVSTSNSHIPARVTTVMQYKDIDRYRSCSVPCQCHRINS